MVEREPIGTRSPIGRQADSLHRLTFRPIACASRRSSIPCQLNGQTNRHTHTHRTDTDPALKLSRFPRSSCADVESTEKIGRILRQHKMARLVGPIIYLSQQGMDWWRLGQFGEIIFNGTASTSLFCTINLYGRQMSSIGLGCCFGQLYRKLYLLPIW